MAFGNSIDQVQLLVNFENTHFLAICGMHKGDQLTILWAYFAAQGFSGSNFALNSTVWIGCRLPAASVDG